MKTEFFDSDFAVSEQLPRQFKVSFETINDSLPNKTRVSIDGVQIGDVIDDNSREKDGYRFHDVFHYTFAALLGWSPCTRSMMKRKRKSNYEIDQIEDGARATITEEVISLLLFNEAKKNDFFQGNNTVDALLLDQIKNMTSSFEVSARSKKEWETTILTGYRLFCDLAKNNGGEIHYDMIRRTAVYGMPNT